MGSILFVNGLVNPRRKTPGAERSSEIGAIHINIEETINFQVSGAAAFNAAINLHAIVLCIFRVP